MAHLMAVYRTPKDPAAFDAYYMGTHIHLAKKAPKLRGYRMSKGPIMTPQGPSDVHLIATMVFDSVPDIVAAFGSPEGQAAAADVGNFATGGVELFIFDEQAV